MSIEEDLLAARRGTITAPAGCGKTQLIAEALRRHQGKLPALVLTHTNAGVGALTTRLQRLSVPSDRYRLSTIDGFAMRVAGKFPRRSGINPKVLLLTNKKADYPAIRNAAIALIQAHHLDDVIASTYGRLLVDEYQDCILPQHAIIDCLAEVLPACVLGDPMQAIFGFAGPIVDWQKNVLSRFPSVGQLETPWRWINAGTKELGAWLLDARRTLEAGGSVDLRGAPAQVQTIILRPADAAAQRMAAARTKAATANGSVMIIGDSMKVAGRHQIASQTPGATCVEAVDLKDLTDFGACFNPEAANALPALFEFGCSVMTNLGGNATLRRVDTLCRGRAHVPANPMEAGLVAFAAEPTYQSAHAALIQMREHNNVRVYRPDILQRCLSALQTTSGGSCTLQEATIRERERFRHRGRPLFSRNVGSTLLLKGLEAEVAVILQPGLMDARHLYVALTRASHRIVVCSETPVLNPVKG
jgi:AAA domain